ncbi:MAG: hypothetical protein J6Q79_01370, partial [Clostridia bacterium]|nr:hypothetical protein [Clostridia bacterium]
VLTEEQKAQARANIGVPEYGGSGGSGEDEIFIAEPETFNGSTGTVSQETIEAAMQNVGVKPVYFHCGDAFIPHTTGGIFTLYGGKMDDTDFCIVVTVDPRTLSFTYETIPLSSGSGGLDITIKNDLTDATWDSNDVPSYGAIKSVIGKANGLATLNESGVIPANQLPSYVDDIIEGYYYESAGKFFEYFEHTGSSVTTRGEITPETGKIYFDLLTENIYRWSGSQYVRINPDEYTVATNADIDALFT